jgi:hypothetical protein
LEVIRVAEVPGAWIITHEATTNVEQIATYSIGFLICIHHVEGFICDCAEVVTSRGCDGVFFLSNFIKDFFYFNVVCTYFV